MMVRSGSIVVALLVAMGAPADGQERDARVLEPGRLNLSIGGEATYISSDFAASGTEPFDGGYSGPLTPVTFSPLGGFATGLGTFFTATEQQSGGGVTDPAVLTAGSLAVEIGWNTRAFPFELAVGVFPRVQLSASIPVFRNERYTRRFSLTEGNVGLNPDIEGNGALMAAISPEFAAVGGSTLLPVDGSPLALELQHRVQALSGQQLALPQAPLTAENLSASFEIDQIPHLLTTWRPGDLELGADVAVLQSFPGLYPAPASGTQYRMSVHGTVRLPTGVREEEDVLLDRGPDVGFQGIGGGVAADLFAGDRFWLSAGGGFTRFGTADVLLAVVPPDGPFSGDIEVQVASRERGSEMDLWATPRLRLTGEISVGATLRSERWGEERYILASQTVTTPSRTRQSLGFSFRYSTLARIEAGEEIPAIDVAIGYSGAFSGSAGIPAPRRAFVQVSYLPKLWGRP